MESITTIIVSKKTLKRLDKYQKSKKLRTRDNTVEDLLEKVEIIEKK